MPNPIFDRIRDRWPNFLDLPEDKMQSIVEEELANYQRDIAAERGIPGQDPEAELRAALPEEGPEGELPVTAGLGVQEADMPEGLGAYTQADVGAPVSDEQAQQWMEEQEIYDAKYNLQTLIRESRNYRQDLIDKQFGGIDPGLRNIEKLGKELAKMEVKTARTQLMEVIGKDDPDEMTPQERLALLNAEDQARRGAMTTIRQQKQDDVATLQQAVGQFNKEQKAEMDLIERRREEILVRQKVQAELETAEAEAREAEAKAREPKPVDQQRLFNMNKHFHKLLEEGKEIPESQLRIYNKLAKKLGEKPIVKKKKGKKGWKLPLLPWVFGGEETEYGTETHKARGKIRKYNPATGRLE